jgi:hypothetical protein
MRLTYVGITLAALALPFAAQAQSQDAVRPLANATAAGSVIASTRPVVLSRLAVTAGASAGYLMVFDATTVPADGTVTPVICRAVTANGSVAVSLDAPARFATGLVLVFSTTGCFSKTISATAFFEYAVR